MKALYILIFFIVYSFNTLGQRCIDLTTNKDKFLVDSLNKVYISLDKDTALRKQVLDWPLFYDPAFFKVFDLMHNDIEAKNVKLNIDVMHVDYFVSTTGNIDYILYELVPAKGMQIQKSDHDYIRSFFQKNHSVELTSTKKFRNHDNLLFSTIKKIIINK